MLISIFFSFFLTVFSKNLKNNWMIDGLILTKSSLMNEWMIVDFNVF